MKSGFNGKSVLITGGSSGIGLATANLFAEHGANIWLLARREPELIQAVQEITAHKKDAGQRFGYVAADVSDFDQVSTAVTQVINEIGVPDILINSAGITEPGYFQDLKLDDFRRLMNVNFIGIVHTTRAILPLMLERDSGYIVNVSSIGGVIGMLGYTAYAASKFAVRGFSDSLRAELLGKGVRISVVYPPDTDTPQLEYELPIRPELLNIISSLDTVMAPNEVAEAILKGVQRNQYMIIPGASNKFWFWLNSLLGTKVYILVDLIINWAKGKLAKAEKTANPPL